MSKEQKVIESSKTILEKTKVTYGEKESLVMEYENLLNEYIKLTGRYSKVIKHGDHFSDSLIKTNERILKMAKKKIKTLQQQQVK